MPSLPRLLQLASPALPVGAYAYSEGLEYAVEAGWVDGERGLLAWMEGRLRHGFGRLDVPVYGRLHAAWSRGDEADASTRSEWLLANRETAELRYSDRAMGQALARILAGLGVESAAPWTTAPGCTFAAMFALACVRWGIRPLDGAGGLAWSWAESQVTAGIKLIPLGQSAGQRVLFRLGSVIPPVCGTGLDFGDDEIGGAAPGLALASCAHEIQRTRLFRS